MSEIQKFTEDILSVANEKAGSIVSKAQNETQQALDEARLSYGREAADIVKSAQNEAEAIKRRQVSEARHRVKLREQEEKNKILSDVLDQTRKRAAQFADDENRYMPYLTKLIVSGVDELGLDNATLHLNSRDQKRFDTRKHLQEVIKQLQRPVKVEMARDPINCTSGAIISSSDGKIRIGNTLEQRFEALESNLLIEAGKVLFG